MVATLSTLATLLILKIYTKNNKKYLFFRCFYFYAMETKNQVWSVEVWECWIAEVSKLLI
jgi:hypothetical protein